MLTDQIQTDLVAAMKAGDSKRRDALRAVKTAIKNEEVALTHSLNDTEAQTVIARMVKQLTQAADEYRSLNDEGRASEESERAEILKQYLPEQLSDDEVRAMIQAAIQESGAASPADMGKVMQVLKPQIGTRADGSKVAQMVREQLSR